MSPVYFSPEAVQDLNEQVDWYEGQRAGLGGLFADATAATLVEIQQAPKLAAICLEPSVRRWQLPRPFHRFSIYYPELPAQLLILAISAHQRNPRELTQRAIEL